MTSFFYKLLQLPSQYKFIDLSVISFNRFRLLLGLMKSAELLPLLKMKCVLE
jgi:hypothetical protein